MIELAQEYGAAAIAQIVILLVHNPSLPRQNMECMQRHSNTLQPNPSKQSKEINDLYTALCAVVLNNLKTPILRANPGDP